MNRISISNPIDRNAAEGVATLIACDIHTLERTIDQSIALASGLAGHFADGRQLVGLSAVYGQDMFSDLSNLLSKIVEARGAVVQAHNRAAKIGRHLQVTHMGPNEGKPTDDRPDSPWPVTGRAEESITA